MPRTIKRGQPGNKGQFAPSTSGSTPPAAQARPHVHASSQSDVNSGGGRIHEAAKQYQHMQQVEQSVATALHDAWRDSWAAQNGGRHPDGTYPPRLKDDGQGGEIDIANTRYEDLPDKWQAENRAAARSAIAAVTSARRQFPDDSPEATVERAAPRIHDDWLSRNASWAPPEQNRPYNELSPEEQDKDRAVARAAVAVLDHT